MIFISNLFISLILIFFLRYIFIKFNFLLDKPLKGDHKILYTKGTPLL